MLYMVECAFNDPAREQTWNDYYSGRKVDEVLAVPGFRTSQRFKAVTPNPAPYIAIHSVDSLEIMTGQGYRGRGGGSFDQSFQPCITHWTRSFWGGLDRAPSFADSDLLAVCDYPEKARGAGVEFVWLKAAGLDSPTPQRGIARISRQQADEIAKTHGSALFVYVPMMPQRQEPADKQAQ